MAGRKRVAGLGELQSFLSQVRSEKRVLSRRIAAVRRAEAQQPALPGMEAVARELIRAKIRRLEQGGEGLAYSRSLNDLRELEKLGKAAAGNYAELHRSFQQARQRSMLDELTGLYNRRFAREELQKHVFPELERTKKPIAIVGIDLVDFGRINNEVSHAEGDAALKRVARILSKSVRAGDHVLRWGGDEFYLVLNSVDAHEKAEMVARRINQKLLKHSLRHPPLKSKGILLQARWKIFVAKPLKRKGWLGMHVFDAADPKKKK